MSPPATVGGEASGVPPRGGRTWGARSARGGGLHRAGRAVRGEQRLSGVLTLTAEALVFVVGLHPAPCAVDGFPARPGVGHQMPPIARWWATAATLSTTWAPGGTASVLTTTVTPFFGMSITSALMPSSARCFTS